MDSNSSFQRHREAGGTECLAMCSCLRECPTQAEQSFHRELMDTAALSSPSYVSSGFRMLRNCTPSLSVRVSDRTLGPAVSVKKRARSALCVSVAWQRCSSGMSPGIHPAWLSTLSSVFVLPVSYARFVSFAPVLQRASPMPLTPAALRK